MPKSPVIGIAAQSFGFGPASKASAVGRTLQGMAHCELVALGEGLAHEYFRREGLCGPSSLHPQHRQQRRELDCELSRLNGLIVALDPDWVAYALPRVPTFFIDSLGFMWTETHFQEHPFLRDVTRYFAQDIFGAAHSLARNGIRNLQPTSAILNPRNHVAPRKLPGILIHLGGVFNIFGTESGTLYLEGITPILMRFAEKLPVRACVLSEQALRYAIIPSSLRPRPLSHAQIADLQANAEAVVSSPGLTTLLECSSVGQRMIPLPPQNWSQALIIQHMNARADTNTVWQFLARSYPVASDMREEEGVRLVADLNSSLLLTRDFIHTYVETVLDALSMDAITMTNIGAPYDGAERCAREVAAVLSLSPNDR
jgi:hypothetical protein